MNKSHCQSNCKYLQWSESGCNRFPKLISHFIFIHTYRYPWMAFKRLLPTLTLMSAKLAMKVVHNSRLNQDNVELLFFSSQRQMCWGTKNKTAFTYGYKVNGIVACRSWKLIKNKQANVYEVEGCLHLAESNQHLSGRSDGRTNIVMTWPVVLG